MHFLFIFQSNTFTKHIQMYQLSNEETVLMDNHDFRIHLLLPKQILSWC